ncbi:MAG: D-alanine--D-alanine ligase [Pyrinomonadaceae bacterium]
MSKLRIGVIFGGRSGEHEVSVRSAHSVIEAIDQARYEIVPIAITKEGKWLAPAESALMLPPEAARLLPEKTFANSSDGVAIIGDPSREGLISFDDTKKTSALSSLPLDVVFPVLHGTYGEDGTLQGLLDMAGVPYIGCGVLASACGMDKVTMKVLFRDAGLPLCKYTWLLRADWEREPAGVVQRLTSEIGYPCFVKPANLGSSVGISRATDNATLEAALNLAARYDRKVIIEEGLMNVREIECAILGNDNPQASLPGEYIVYDEGAAFLDYREKYANTGHVEFVVPAPLSEDLTKVVQEMASRAFKAIDGAGLARVDFFLRRDTNELLVNEINTLPGLTNVSGYPKMWAMTGLEFSKVIDRLIELAFARHKDKMQNETSL